jgi:hypothetical protein
MRVLINDKVSSSQWKHPIPMEAHQEIYLRSINIIFDSTGGQVPDERTSL